MAIKGKISPKKTKIHFPTLILEINMRSTLNVRKDLYNYLKHTVHLVGEEFIQINSSFVPILSASLGSV